MARVTAQDGPIRVSREGRFSRFEAVAWWDQSRLRNARILVVGAGALGNEAIKNLALLGIGALAVVDMDRIERSNLSRSVLFRESDEGRYKAVSAVDEARRIYPGARGLAIVGNVLSDVGLGVFRWADVVLGALDNREARLFVNRACAQVGRPWIDGGIDVLNGIVRGFRPPATACYECTMSAADWEILRVRRSCSLLARQAAENAGTPTTPTTASVVGAIQAQEVVKYLHEMESLWGRGVFFEGTHHNSYTLAYPVAPDCPWHEPPPPIESVIEISSASSLETVWRWAEARLGGLDALDFSREIVMSLSCPSCESARRILRSPARVTANEIACPQCGSECVPTFMHSATGNSALLSHTVAELGLPPLDVVWARRGDQVLGVEMTGDVMEFENRFEGTRREW